MKGKIVLAGGSGFLGKQLYTHLKAKGYEPLILTRSPQIEGYNSAQWNPSKGELPVDHIDDAQAFINLAGRNVGDKRWSLKFKTALVQSRKQSTHCLVSYLNNVDQNDITLVNASAIGYYGFNRDDELLDEDSDPGSDFFGDLCFQWEKEAKKLENDKVRLAIARIGIVLSSQEGAYPKLKAPILAGIGSPLASGNQWISWIHLQDVLKAITWIIEKKELSGTFNLTSPNAVRNKTFIRKTANSLNKQIIFPKVPGFALKLIAGEFANALIGGLHVQPKALQESGYAFEYEKLEDAVKDLNWGSKQ